MKIFTALETQWNSFIDAINKYTSKKLGKDGSYGPSNIFGQIFTVLNGVVQNLMLYIEDAFTEQNIYTAERKKSIYSLARLSGYEPSLGTASKCDLKLVYNSTATLFDGSIVIPNKTKIINSKTGLIYNIILPQDTCIYDINKNSCIHHIAAVEGTFENQSYTVTGGELYTINIEFNGDVDLDYLRVRVNGEEWTKRDGLYDMEPDGKEYWFTTGMDSGIDLIFGNGQFGRILQEGDVVDVEYLSHNGEDGNINVDDDSIFIFNTNLSDTSGNEVDGNKYFNIQLEDNIGVYNGTYSESAEQVKKMIGFNSRSLVLAGVDNYKIFLNKFSFVGYNRCWSEPGSLVVNALVMKNYNSLCENGRDYFNLNDSDFMLSEAQKESINKAIVESGQQIGGTIFNFIEPIIKKYAMFVYVKMKSGVVYDKEVVTGQIKNLIGEFFGNIKSDIYIPKSDIIHLIKSNIPQVDGVDVYIIGEDNEKVKASTGKDRTYTEIRFKWNPLTLTYYTEEKTILIPEGEDPMIGFDGFGNILLENDMYFPTLRGGWSYTINDNGEVVTVDIQDNDPVQVIFN